MCCAKFKRAVVDASYILEAQRVRMVKALVRTSLFPLRSKTCVKPSQNSSCIEGLRAKVSSRSREFAKWRN